MIYISNNEKITTIADDESIIILSPKVYWFETLEIPTKSLNKAKKIANNILSNRPSHYKDISLFKKNGKFFVYCYDRDDIEAVIKSLNIDIIQFKVYFLEEIEIKESLKVDEELFLIPFENKIIENKTTSSNNLKSLTQYLKEGNLPLKPLLNFNLDKTKTKKTLLAVNIFLALFVVSYIFLKVSTLNGIDKEIKNLEIKDKTNYEIESVISSYSKKAKAKAKFKREFQQLEIGEQPKNKLTYENRKFRIGN